MFQSSAICDQQQVMSLTPGQALARLVLACQAIPNCTLNFKSFPQLQNYTAKCLTIKKG